MKLFKLDCQPKPRWIVFRSRLLWKLGKVMKTNLLVLFCVVASALAVGSTVTYSDENSFVVATGTKITDDYSNPNYVYFQSDAGMTGVLNETRYQSTTYPDTNIVWKTEFGNHAYCGGCNGGFNLFFDSTSIGNSSGVYGVGFQVGYNTNFDPAYTLVTFGDNTTELFALPRTYDFSGYFGITSDKLIKEMSMVEADGTVPPPNAGYWDLAISRLTIAAVPEPGSLTMLATGVLGVATVLRRRLF